MGHPHPDRRRPSLPLLAAGLLPLILLALLLAPGEAGARTASCSGGIQGTSFHFSCNQRIGGNSRGWLFSMSSHSIENATVSSPAGVGCEGRSGRVTCSGPAIRAGATVSGSLVLRPTGGEEEGAAEEGELACPGEVEVMVLAYGGDSAEGEPGEGEEEGGEEEGEIVPVPEDIARFGISSCPQKQEEGPRGGPQATFSLGKVKLNREKGTANLPVKVSAAGTLTLKGENLVKVTKAVKAAGTVRLTVKPRGAAKALLHATGTAHVKATVVYTPSGGEAAAKSKKITLKLV